MTTYKKNRKGGYVDYYSSTPKDNDYMLEPSLVLKNPDVYVPPDSDSALYDLDSSSLYSLPNMNGGGGYRKARDCGMKKCDAFEFNGGNSFLYSLKGGCACNASSVIGGNEDDKYNKDAEDDEDDNDNNDKDFYKGGEKFRKRGGAFSLAPYVTAISLLAARILADKKLGFFANESEVVGGSDLKNRRYRRRK